MAGFTSACPMIQWRAICDDGAQSKARRAFSR
jgi:hypothetical protein